MSAVLFLQSSKRELGRVAVGSGQMRSDCSCELLGHKNDFDMQYFFQKE